MFFHFILIAVHDDCFWMAKVKINKLCAFRVVFCSFSKLKWDLCVCAPCDAHSALMRNLKVASEHYVINLVISYCISSWTN